MATRRFDDDMADAPASYPAGPPPEPVTESEIAEAEPAAAPVTPQPRTPRGNARNLAHMPRTLAQVLNDANEQVVRGDLSDYVPLPTGLDPLDGLIGGGLRKTELLLLGGPQGIGKTIATLQIARNIAMRKDQYAFYLSYEHTETHLMNRLLSRQSSRFIRCVSVCS